MKERFYNISGILFIILCMTSCQKYSYIENELHGMWQVTSVEEFSTGEITEAEGRLYYSFQRSMVMLGYKKPTIPVGQMMQHYIAHFDLSTDSIEMGDFRIYSPTGVIEQETKVPLNDLYKFGLYQDYTTFHMQLSQRKLILTSNEARIILRKY